MSQRQEFDHEYIKAVLKAMGFSLIDGESHVWFKKYSGHDDFQIKIFLDETELADCSIEYGDRITIGRRTTTNFSQRESLVVLECVNRLLEKAYKPECIELERGWRVGGYLDILVRDKNDKSYLMIECKQSGTEYNSTIKVILANNHKKEQLFNYYLQEKSTKFLALYTHEFSSEDKIVYQNDIIKTDGFRDCDNQQEIYEKWDKVFQSKGIFESNAQPYNIKFTGLRRGDLKTLNQAYVASEEDTDGSIYNRFAEILRRHTVSDKTNAYNKIFNLFLCKIVDEDNHSSPNEEMDVQWRPNETHEEVLSRLNDLYKQGMKNYLKLDVADVTEEELDSVLQSFTNSNENTVRIRQMFKQLRLYKNNEFAFKEVIDERTFRENAEVVKEVVKLLERYQIKYSHKHQFMGDFFERLLNIGVKQEAGQFFTPIPIASFICKSIPFEQIIDRKIKAKDPNFLPYVIDYACGSGHFLTEAMDRIDRILTNIKSSHLQTKLQKDNLIGWKTAYKWAIEFVYGIEKDYRLAKTSKVACFLNGDGEANIFYADGLDSFSSERYIGRLQSKDSGRDKSVFDVVIANPPYSVENFKFLLNGGRQTFELYDDISEKSDDIECLFIERAKHLLPEGGYAGLILPRSVLVNAGIHQKARELLLRNFEVYGICELGDQTFAVSGQKTAVLFLRRRSNNFFQTALGFIDKFLKTKKDFSFSGIEDVIQQYLAVVYPNISWQTYGEMLKDDPNEIEKKKLLYFLLTFNQQVIIAQSGEKEEEKLFLGYEHSARRKYEGVHLYPNNPSGEIVSKLYDDKRLDHPDKISTFLLNNFLGRPLPSISAELSGHIRIKLLHELIDFTSNDFHVKIHLDTLKNPFLTDSKYSLAKLGDPYVAEILDSFRKPVKQSKRISGGYPYYGASHKIGTIDKYLFDEKLVLIGEDGARWGKGEETAYIIDGKAWVNNHAHIIRPNTKKLTHEYLKLIFDRFDFSYLKSRPNGGKLLKSDLVEMRFPLPTVAVQKKVVSQLSKKVG